MQYTHVLSLVALDEYAIQHNDVNLKLKSKSFISLAEN